MNIIEYIKSGILEQYVLGLTSEEESLEVEQAAAKYAEVQKEIEEISNALENYAISNAVQPSCKVKPFLMATIDYMERMEKGEAASFPPILNNTSKIEDYARWLSREDMILPVDAEDIFAKIICFTPELQTAIIWIKDYAPAEQHHDEQEKFLILEGTCDILIDDDTYSLVPGDYFAVPLHKTHIIKVTSENPCKVLLQRVAA